MKQKTFNQRRNDWFNELLMSLAPDAEKRIILSNHYFEQGRQYTKRDVVNCLVTGTCIGWSDQDNQIVTHNTGKGVIVGRDSFDQQIVVIIGQTSRHYVVVTAFPPLDVAKYGCTVA